MLRHGLTAWNAPPRRCQGQLDVPLSPRGREQAQRLAPGLPSFTVAWSSPLVRARETAEILLDARSPRPELGLDARLAEAHCGAWQGELHDELARRWPRLWKQLAREDLELTFPDGERLGVVLERFSAVIAELEDRYRGRRALVVSHGGPMRLFLTERGLLSTTEPGSPPGNLEGFTIEGARIDLFAPK